MSASTEQIESIGTQVIFPEKLAVGLLLKPYPFLRLAFEYSIIYWSNAQLSNYYDIEGTLQFPIRDDFTFSQKDSVNYRMGIEFNIPLDRASLFIRGGLFRDQQLFVDGESPAAPVKFKGFSLGIGIDILAMFQVDIGYMRQKSFWNEPAYFETGNYVKSLYKNDIFSISLTFSFDKRK